MFVVFPPGAVMSQESNGQINRPTVVFVAVESSQIPSGIPLRLGSNLAKEDSIQANLIVHEEMMLSDPRSIAFITECINPQARHAPDDIRRL